MRERYHEALRQLTAELAGLADCCERAIEAAERALLAGDRSAADEAIRLEIETDHRASEAEGRCLHLLMTQQPVAADLRLIGAAMKMSTDLERIGDQCADIAAIAGTASFCIEAPLKDTVREMAALCTSVLRDAVSAYDLRDADLARAAIDRDRAIDADYAAAKASITATLPAQNGDPLDLFLCVKYFERIGDHAQNVAEWVEYALCGIYRGREL